MGLITPVELTSLDQLGGVHFIAIGGSGMNGIASMMLAHGIRVSDDELARQVKVVPVWPAEPEAAPDRRA